MKNSKNWACFKVRRTLSGIGFDLANFTQPGRRSEVLKKIYLHRPKSAQGVPAKIFHLSPDGFV